MFTIIFKPNVFQFIYIQNGSAKQKKNVLCNAIACTHHPKAKTKLLTFYIYVHKKKFSDLRFRRIVTNRKNLRCSLFAVHDVMNRQTGEEKLEEMKKITWMDKK